MGLIWRTSTACEKSPNHDVSQDSICVKWDNKKPQLVCLALSDGAGSASKSEYGSKALVEGIANAVWHEFYSYVNLIQEQGKDVFISKVIDVANKILENVSIQEGCKMKDLSSTLMFVASDGKTALWFHVGDGVIIQRSSGSFFVLSHPFNGEYANETIFVNSLNAKNVARADIFKLSEVNYSFFLMSDGPETVFYSKTNRDINSRELLSFIDEKNRSIEDENYRNELLKYILHERCRPYSPDDLSIVVAELIRTLQEKKNRRNRKRKYKVRCRHYYKKNRKRR